jgi:hypothetical protein
MFEPGNQANRAGRPKGSQSQTTLIKCQQKACVDLLENVVKDANADPTLRVAAASALLTANREPTAAI